MGYARNSPLRVLENDSFTAQGSRKPHPLLLIAANFFLSVYSVGSLYITLLGISGQPISGRATPILTVTAFLFAVIHAWGRMGWKRALLLLVLSTGISLVFESLGVATGLVYGAYHYTGQLGPKVLGLVPFLIPVAWFMMMYPSLLMAAYMQPASRQKSWKILSVAAAGALIMTAWDTVMDPMMVKAGHWVWETDGAYFGIPLQNYWGWWLTTFTVFAVFLLLRPEALRIIQPAPGGVSSLKGYDALAVTSYLVTALSMATGAWLMGLQGPAIIGTVLMGIAVFLWIIRR